MTEIAADGTEWNQVDGISGGEPPPGVPKHFRRRLIGALESKAKKPQHK